MVNTLINVKWILMGSLISRWQNYSVSFGDFQSQSDTVHKERAFLTCCNWLKKFYSLYVSDHMPASSVNTTKKICSVRVTYS